MVSIILVCMLSNVSSSASMYVRCLRFIGTEHASILIGMME